MNTKGIETVRTMMSREIRVQMRGDEHEQVDEVRRPERISIAHITGGGEKKTREIVQ